MVILLAILIPLFSCASKGETNIEWKKIIEARLKDTIRKPSFIDMRWIYIPEKNSEKEVKGNEE